MPATRNDPHDPHRLEANAYEMLREIAARHGGTMRHQKQGYQWGAWMVEIGEYRRVFRSNGAGCPELDRLYVPRVVFPRHHSEYRHELLEDAEQVFLSMVMRGRA